MKFTKIALASMVLGGSLLLSACGGGGGVTAPAVASTDASISINPTSGAAVVNAALDKSYSFVNGVSAFGTTAPTSLTLSGSGTTPTFEVGSGTTLATGQMTYGSCIFTVARSDFLNNLRLDVGSRVVVTPCTLSLDTSGKVADGSTSAVNVTLILGNSESSPISVQVSISPGGQVTVNNSVVGTVTLTTATGAGS
jgi:hypothetical protein